MEEIVFVNYGSTVFKGQVLRRYSWGALVQCGYQCYKVGQNCLFKTFQAAKEAQLAEMAKNRTAGRNGGK